MKRHSVRKVLRKLRPTEGVQGKIFDNESHAVCTPLPKDASGQEVPTVPVGGDDWLVIKTDDSLIIFDGTSLLLHPM